jgi:aarF domain-containing kinase
MYIKFGQQIAQQAAILPPQYNEVFRVMYDKAPVVPLAQVEKIFSEEFNKLPSEMFSEFDEEPIASASIAQVHIGKLQDGTKVAVKVQKPYIKKQLDYDLATYKLIAWGFEKVFDLPMYWATEYTEKHLRQEVDFINEGKNSEVCQSQINTDSYLKGEVYVPKVYWDKSSERVLTAEWIDGTPLSQHEKVIDQGYNLKSIMKVMVDLFAFQIFVTGFVHCDPHPGNIIIRKNPQNPSKTQLVLIDHGLYIQQREEFRREYCLFWKSLFSMDREMIEAITRNWGIKDSNLFATATLFKPYSVNSHNPPHMKTRKISKEEMYQAQLKFKARAQQFLSDTSLIPRELIFLGRNMNIVRANNKNLNSPVNRITLMVKWAIKGLGSDWTLHTLNPQVTSDPLIDHSKSLSEIQTLSQMNSLTSQIMFQFNYLRFMFTLYSFDVVFAIHQWYQSINRFFGYYVSGFEDTLDQGLKETVKSEFNIDINVNDGKLFES